MSNPANRIIIADTQFLIVTALMVLLDGQAENTVEAVSSAPELYKALEKETCQLLITDPLLFDYNPPGGLQDIKRKFPKLSILILSNSLTRPEFTELTKIGIKNIVNKTADREDILAAIDAAIKGKKYFSEEILDMILEMGESKASPEEPTHLTNSEIEIVKLIAGGLTTKEIAHQKNISFHTVNTHRKNIFRKLNVSNASELIMHAIRAGWIDNIEYFI
ncbi:MAG TPA: response regulator transcription factor [Prolixibacteraceae bacterium]|jgi:DNA-binding NarL/FixJ family response regulator